ATRSADPIFARWNMAELGTRCPASPADSGRILPASAAGGERIPGVVGHRLLGQPVRVGCTGDPPSDPDARAEGSGRWTLGVRSLGRDPPEHRRLPPRPRAAGGVAAAPPDSTTPARTAEHPSSPPADTSPEAAEYRAGSPPAATGYGAFGTTAGPSSAPGATE